MSTFIPLRERPRRRISMKMKKVWILKKRNYRHKEIAEILGVSIHAVNKMVYRTRKRVNKYPDCIDYKELNEIFETMKKQIDDYFR